MIDIFGLYERFRSMNNTSQNGFFRPVRDFIPAVHTVSLETFNILCAEMEDTEQHTDMLLPFFKSENVIITITPTREYAPYPLDYSYMSSAKILVSKAGLVCGSDKCDTVSDGKCLHPEDIELLQFKLESEYTEVKIKLVPDSKFDAATNHVTKKPTLQRPIGSKISEGIKIAPNGVGVILLNYYRNPVEPVMDYDNVQVGVDVEMRYKKATSTQLEWDEKMIPVFLYRLCQHYGIFISDELKIQVGQLSKKLI